MDVVVDAAGLVVEDDYQEGHEEESEERHGAAGWPSE